MLERVANQLFKIPALDKQDRAHFRVSGYLAEVAALKYPNHLKSIEDGGTCPECTFQKKFLVVRLWTEFRQEISKLAL